MKDFELESKLKTVRVPARTDEYWEDFPSRVRAELRPVLAARAPRRVFFPRLVRAGGFALACTLFAFVVFPSLQITLKKERALQHELAQLPQHLRVLMADEHGLHYLVAGQQ